MADQMMAPSLDSAPPSPPNSSMSSLGWGAKPDAGMGPAASDPQIQALQAVKMIEMGVQQLSIAVPELAGPLQSFVQQISAAVPQLMTQQMMGSPMPSLTPAPPTGA